MLSNESMTGADCRECGTPLPAGWGEKPCPLCLMQVSVFRQGESLPAGEQGEGGLVLGDCELLEEIGRGGMGVVYRARQRRLGRVVAVKVLAAGDFASPEAKRRFRQEAEAASRLQHPGIVAIHDVGEADGLPWMSMDYVAGGTLGDLVREKPLAPLVAASFVQAVAEAVEHAHAHGVFHRDIKPSNVLLDRSTGPRITDFGIARWAESGVRTRSGEALGSPSYSAPEQVLGLRTTDARTDVYGLGALLYHLLTGRPPFHASTLEAVLLMIRESDPVAPRSLNPAVPKDLETICLHCLRKEPDRRYATAREVSDDLRRFAEGAPIQARPASALGKAVRWARRRPALASLLALLALTAGASVWSINEARRAAQKASRSAEAASSQLRSANTRLADLLDSAEFDRANDRFLAGETGEGLALLSRVARRTPEHPVAVARLASCLWHGGFAIPKTGPFAAGGYVEQMRLLPDGHSLLLAMRHGVAVHSFSSGELLWRFDPPGQRLGAGGALSRDGSLYATWSARGDGATHVFEVSSGKRLASVAAGGGPPLGVDISPDASLLLVAGPGKTAGLLETRTGHLSGALLTHEDEVACAQFSPDGRTIATAAGRTVKFWDASSHRLRHESPAGESTVSVLAWAPNGSMVAAGCLDGTVRFLSATDGLSFGQLMRHGGEVLLAVFDRDGTRLVTASKDHTARLWLVADGAPIGPALRHRDKLTFAAFSPDGRRVVTCASDHAARVWDAHTGRATTQPLRHLEQPLAAVFSPDGSSLATAGADGLVRRWELRASDPGRSTAVPASTVESDGRPASADGRYKAMIEPGSSEVRVMEAASGELVGTPLRHFDRVAAVEFSPDGSMIATASFANEARVWDTLTGQPVGKPLRHSRTVSSVAFSPDGTRLATASWDGQAQVWSIRDGTPIGRALNHRDRVNTVSFSPNGRRVATGSGDGSVRVWEAASGQPLTEWLESERGGVSRVRFSADGQSLTTEHQDGATLTWEVPDFPVPPPAWLVDFADSIAQPDVGMDHLRAWAGIGGEVAPLPAPREEPGTHEAESTDVYGRLAQRLAPAGSR